MTARAYTGPFPCNLTRTMADVISDEADRADLQKYPNVHSALMVLETKQSGADAAATKSGSGMPPAKLDRTGGATPRHMPASAICSRVHPTSADDEYRRAIMRAAGPVR